MRESTETEQIGSSRGEASMQPMGERSSAGSDYVPSVQRDGGTPSQQRMHEFLGKDTTDKLDEVEKHDRGPIKSGTLFDLN